MKLTYYYLVFEHYSDDCPGELWEGILSCLRVVFSAYGYTEETKGLHDLHVICEDDLKKTIYKQLPQNIKVKICKRQSIKSDIKQFLERLVPVLKDDEGLCIVDNTNSILALNDGH